MVPRWDALLVAAIVSGGSLWIESSQRIDTGAPDGSPASLCTGAVAHRAADPDLDDQPISLGAADDDAALPDCD